MNPEPYPLIHEERTPDPKNRFPIVIQLGVLLLVLVIIFSGLWLHETSGTNTVNEVPPPITPIQPIDDVVPQKLEEVTVRASAAYVWDVRAQRALFAKNAETALPIASITKLMTALLAHELLASDTITTIDLSAIEQEGSNGLVAGERFSIENLQELALISSSNDAAFALGATVGSALGENDATSQFVAGMNIRAEELGLTTMKFYNPTGLDVSPSRAGGYGSARDVSFLMEYIIEEYPEIILPTTEQETRVYNTAGQFHTIENTNDYVRQIPNLIGSKTGFTDLAGGNLTIAFDIGLNRPIIVTVLGSTREGRFQDVLTLVNAVQDSIE